MLLAPLSTLVAVSLAFPLSDMSRRDSLPAKYKTHYNKKYNQNYGLQKYHKPYSRKRSSARYATLIETIQGQTPYTGHQDDAVDFVSDQIRSVWDTNPANDTLTLMRMEIEESARLLNESLAYPDKLTFAGELTEELDNITYSDLSTVILGLIDELKKQPNATAVLNLIEHGLGIKATFINDYWVLGPYVGFLARMAQLAVKQASKETTTFRKLQAALNTFFITGPISMAVTGESTTAKGVDELCKYFLHGILCDNPVLQGKLTASHANPKLKPVVKRDTASSAELMKHFGDLMNLSGENRIVKHDYAEDSDDYWLRRIPFTLLTEPLLDGITDSLRNKPPHERMASMLHIFLRLPSAAYGMFFLRSPHLMCNMIANLGQICNELPIFAESFNETHPTNQTLSKLEEIA
jgi:hypothetical protein